MPRVLFINGQGAQVAETFARLAPVDFAVQVLPYGSSPETVLAALGDTDYLVLHPATLPGEIIRQAGHLGLIQLLAAGYDKVDLAAAQQLGIPVATNGGANAWAVAEHAIALLLGLYKRLTACDAAVRRGDWRQPVDGFNTFELAGKMVGIVGAGNIGRKVARRLHAFETQILYYDPNEVPELEEALGARRIRLDELVAQADVISLHAPLTPDTRGLLGAPQFAAMKPGTVLINTSRAELVDEAALIDALQQRKIAGAGLDVFHPEPIRRDHPLLTLDNVLLTPHTAGHAYEGWARRCEFAWLNLRRVAAGTTPLSLVRSGANG